MMPALAYVLIIGDPTRFQRGKQIGTYVGMIPCEDPSAGKQRLGHNAASLRRRYGVRMIGLWKKPSTIKDGRSFPNGN
jgi:transposase